MKNFNTNPGLFAGAKEDIGKFFRSMGASDESVRSYLKVSPGDLEASQKLTTLMAVESVKQISSRATQMEFQRFLEANPNIFQTPEGFKRVSQFLEVIANDTLNEQKEFLAAKKVGLKPDEYSDFPAMYNQKRAAAIRAGKFNSTPPQPTASGSQPAPGQQPQQPQQPQQAAPPQQAAAPGGQAAPAEGTTKQLGGRTYIFRNGQWGVERT
jgi:hypothetical protein